jgi:Peptidase S46
MNSADLVLGNLGSPVVNRKGEVMGVAAWAPNMINQLAYGDDESDGGAVAARGILEILDKVYHANKLVNELSGKTEPSARPWRMKRLRSAAWLPAPWLPSRKIAVKRPKPLAR